MPVNLSIKGVPDRVAAGLRARAARNHRSLQRELMAIVEVAAEAPEPSRGRMPPAGREVAGPTAAELFAQAPAAAPRPIEELFDEWRQLFPRTRNRGPSATETIRRMRDGRFGGASEEGRLRGRPA
jgi:plasmid stability protein